jgi:hypothetical protein
MNDSSVSVRNAAFPRPGIDLQAFLGNDPVH